MKRLSPDTEAKYAHAITEREHDLARLKAANLTDQLKKSSIPERYGPGSQLLSRKEQREKERQERIAAMDVLRGLAVLGHTIYMGTLDGHLLALASSALRASDTASPRSAHSATTHSARRSRHNSAVSRAASASPSSRSVSAAAA